MRESINFPLSAAAAAAWGGWSGVAQDCARLGLAGVEGIWAGEEVPAGFPKPLLAGYHLTFFPDWLDFYRDDRQALKEKFGALDKAWAFYGGRGPETLLALYRADLERAAALGAPYVVFHMSDVSIEEGFTYRWRHTHKEVIDTSVEILNLLLGGEDRGFWCLLENQWWPGFTFTDPEQTEAMLAAVRYPKTGIMLDTGHLMNTNPDLKSQEEGIDYIRAMAARHGSLAKAVRGVHLHQSLSGDYVRTHVGAVPPELPEEYFHRYQFNYRHIQSIDRHQPWTCPGVAALVEELDPCFLTHELAAADRRAMLDAVGTQLRALRGGGHGLAPAGEI